MMQLQLYQQCNIRFNYDDINNAIYDAIMTLSTT